MAKAHQKKQEHSGPAPHRMVTKHSMGVLFDERDTQLSGDRRGYASDLYGGGAGAGWLYS